MRYVTTRAVLLALCFPVGLDTAEAQSKRRGKAPSAQKRSKGKSAKGGAKQEEKVKRFVFTGLDLEGQMRTPQLLYFLDRVNEELERASLERRSFIPEMVRSVDEEAL